MFNSQRFIKDAVHSVRLQSYSPIETIVIDDGSTDESANLVRSMEGIRYFYQIHSGVAAARNLGISKASGSFLAFLDSDDLWDKEKIGKQVRLFIKDPELDCIFSKFENFFDPESQLPSWMNRDHFTAEKFKSMKLLCTMLVRSEVYERVGFFKTKYLSGEDIEWFTRLKDAGTRYLFMPEILVSRRLHDSNLSYKKLFNQRDLLQVLKTSIDRKRSNDSKCQDRK